MLTSVQVRVEEVVQRRVQGGRDSDGLLRGVILKRANSPPRITARRGGGVIKKMVRSLLIDAAGGGVPCSIDRNTTPSSRKRMLRDIFLIARDFAFSKMMPNLDSCGPGSGTCDRHTTSVRLTSTFLAISTLYLTLHAVLHTGRVIPLFRTNGNPRQNL